MLTRAALVGSADSAPLPAVVVTSRCASDCDSAAPMVFAAAPQAGQTIHWTAAENWPSSETSQRWPCEQVKCLCMRRAPQAQAKGRQVGLGNLFPRLYPVENGMKERLSGLCTALGFSACRYVGGRP